MKHTVMEKEKLVERYYQGESASTICWEKGIARSTFYTWLNIHKTTVTEAGNVVSPAAFLKLKKNNERLTKMVEVLQKVDCAFFAPPSEKLYALEKLYGQYSVRVLCDAFGVDRGTFYNHVLRNKKKNKSYQARRDELSAKILQVYEESNQIFGAKKIRFVLAEQGVFTSEKMVSELMREMNIASIRLSAKRDHLLLNRDRRKRDHLKKDFSAQRPNQAWVSDITYFKLKGKMLFICAIIDLHSRKVIAYKISQKHSTQLVTSTFKLAYENRRPKEGLIFHSDRGGVYTSHSLQSLLRTLNITQSFSPAGSPYHNAAMESFFSALKKEELYSSNYRSLSDLKERISQYMEFYNMKRPHSTLKYMTPNAYEARYSDIDQTKRVGQ